MDVTRKLAETGCWGCITVPRGRGSCTFLLHQITCPQHHSSFCQTDGTLQRENLRSHSNKRDSAWCWPKDAEEKALRTGTLLPPRLNERALGDGKGINLFTSVSFPETTCPQLPRRERWSLTVRQLQAEALEVNTAT
ncbi:PREDICTED: uncharacterized protein LOC101369014 [Odobenus rosmarus divergens]|uniref:Uncharacterized protein LOC101369014 n=1 Tax=Odobenus rosmarus divergens TaxID=9708 RepID=A0A2U3VX54_ODORO|nr:PREDICTED: uncharacterized protein LOC101369014 [Odobenus rosmarus divergens]